MSEGAKIEIQGDASGFIQATEQTKQAARKMGEELKGAIGSSTGAAVKGLKGMDLEGRKLCKRLNAGLINMSATISATQAGINALGTAWARFSGLLGSGDDVGRVTARLAAFTKGTASAAKGAREVVEFADTPPFGLEETQRAAQLLLGCGIRASELKSTLESLGNVAAGGGASLEQMGIRLAKAFQTGRVTMEVLEPLMNSGINVMGELSKRTGKTQAELQKMMQKGQLGFRDLLGALLSMGAAGGQFAGAMEKNTQDLDSRMEALKGKVGALGRTFAEPVTGGIKQAMDEVGAAWAGHGPEVERGLKSVGALLGDIAKGAAPVVSVVGSGFARLATGSGIVEKGVRSVIVAFTLWRLSGTKAGSAVAQACTRSVGGLRSVRAEALRLRVEAAAAGGQMSRMSSGVIAGCNKMKAGWRAVGAQMKAAMAGTGIMLLIAGVTELIMKLHALGQADKEVIRQKKEKKRNDDDFDKRIWKGAEQAQSRQDVNSLMDEYDAEIQRIEREYEDLEEPLGSYGRALQDRVVFLQNERAELLKVASANAKAAQDRESAARRAIQDEEERKKTLEKIREIEHDLLSIDYDRAAAEAERRRSGLGLEERRKDLLGSYGSLEGIRRAIEEQRALLSGSDAVDGVLNLEGVQSKIKSLYGLMEKVEEVDREIVQRNKSWDKAEQQHHRQTEVLRAQIAGEREKLRVLKEQARVLELQGQYEGAGMSKARAGAAAQEAANMERNRDREQAARDYRKNAAMLKAQAEGNKAEERRLKMAERIKEIYNQQRDSGVDKKTALERAGYITGLEDRIDRKKNRKDGGPIADSMAQIGGGGRSMIGSMPQLTEARTQTGLLRQLVRNTARGVQGAGRAAPTLGY